MSRLFDGFAVTDEGESPFWYQCSALITAGVTLCVGSWTDDGDKASSPAERGLGVHTEDRVNQGNHELVSMLCVDNGWCDALRRILDG